ncbi:MAG: J domain-containing protein [Candidatus Fermentibacteria bacterium]|nr:J domain-containing protein [Candidatus Fermentibacteria bacterium]
MTKDLYEILGVAEKSSPDELRKAYRNLAKKNHPDANPDDAAAEERFKRISDAYDILGNPEKREEYDLMRQRGHDPFSGNSGGDEGFGDLSDILRSMFGGGGGGSYGGRRSASRGASRVSIEIPFVTAAKGGTVQRVLQLPVVCRACGGVGGSGKETCASCGGSGRISSGQGFFSTMHPCANCGGRGYTLKKKCATCSGTGEVRSNEKVSLRIPPGVSDGTTLRTSVGGKTVLVQLRIKKDRFFTRQGRDILCSVTVTASQAVLGSALMVRTLDGKVKLRIKAGTQPGTVLRMRSKGVVHNGVTGDQLVTVVVKLPADLNDEQRLLWTEVKEAGF